MRESTILLLPICSPHTKNVSPVQVPTLFILEQPQEGAYWELSSYLFDRLRGNLISATQALKIAKTMQRFINIFDLCVSDGIGREKLLSEILGIYCLTRISGTEALSNQKWKTLKWSPVANSTVRSEFTSIIDFFIYCQSEFGHENFRIGSTRYRISSFVRNAYRARKVRDFLIHLNTQRSYWEAVLKKQEYVFPSILRAPPSPDLSRADKAIDVEELEKIVLLEPNPVFKSLFILYGYGGLRRSEPLHFWQIDIRPPDDWKFVSKHASSRPLILRCHPSQSKFLGSFSKGAITRTRYLAERYQIVPRNMLPNNSISYAGWKGTRPLHKLMFSPVFFLANPQIMEQFSAATHEIIEHHHCHRTSAMHPFFFCNIASTRYTDFGTPTTYTNVQNAWVRAVRRAGLNPYENNRNLHALRHRYVANAEALGLSARSIRDMVGHSSLESQNKYGNLISTLHEKLNSLEGKVSQ